MVMKHCWGESLLCSVTGYYLLCQLLTVSTFVTWSADLCLVRPLGPDQGEVCSQFC